MSIRKLPEYREKKRRSGSVYVNNKGELGLGPFTLEARMIILRKLLELEVETGMQLITLEELREIDRMWDQEGDLSRRQLVDMYFEIKRGKLPWDEYKTPIFQDDVINEIKKQCEESGVEFELISKLIIEIDANKNFTRSSAISKAFDKVMNQGWLHFDAIQEGLNNDN